MTCLLPTVFLLVLPLDLVLLFTNVFKLFPSLLVLKQFYNNRGEIALTHCQSESSFIWLCLYWIKKILILTRVVCRSTSSSLGSCISLFKNCMQVLLIFRECGVSPDHSSLSLLLYDIESITKGFEMYRENGQWSNEPSHLEQKIITVTLHTTWNKGAF